MFSLLHELMRRAHARGGDPALLSRQNRQRTTEGITMRDEYRIADDELDETNDEAPVEEPAHTDPRSDALSGEANAALTGDAMAPVSEDMVKAGDTNADTKADTKMSVDDLCEAQFPPSHSGRPHADRWQHGAAAALHRWNIHAHDQNGPMRLTPSDYVAAIAAALKPDATPHKAALYDDGASK